MCHFLKNLAFNAIESFQQGQEFFSPKMLQNYEVFGISILDFEDANAFVVLDHKKYITSIIPSLLKPGLGQNHYFGRIAS